MAENTKHNGRPKTRSLILDNPDNVETLRSGLVSGLSVEKACAFIPGLNRDEVYLRMARDPAFKAIIAGAREAQQDAIIESLIDMADKATPETVNVVKLQIWARQWVAAKLAPKKYGDKQAIELTGRDGGPIQTAVATIDVGRLDDEARAQLRAALVDVKAE